MKKIAIVLDDWKLPIFKKTLENKGYEYDEFFGPDEGVTTLIIQAETIEELIPIVKKMQKEASNFKKKKLH